MPRLLLIGLDSADAELIERWCDEGDLPNLSSLREHGVWGRLGTTADSMHVSAWPTLYTGSSPARHGMYHAYQVRAHEQGVHRTRPGDCALPPFWRYLDDAGRKCIVFDAFMDYRLPGFRGTHVLEYGTWTWFGRPASTPRLLRRELIRRVGPYPAPEHLHVLSVPDPHQFRDQLVAGAETKARATRWLLSQDDWDMAFVTFGETHGGGHYLWHTGDPVHPASREYDVSGAADALRDVYRAVDRAIGSILETVGDATTVAVFSGDGMGPNYSAAQLMPEFLRRRGWLADSAASASGLHDEPASSASRGKGLLSRVREAIPLGVRQAVTRCLPRSLHYRMSMKWVNDAVNWDASKVFCIPNANEGYFRVNLKGREPRGVVGHGEEEAAVLRELVAELETLVNPDNRARAVEKVVCVDEAFTGEERGGLPDVIVAWRPDARVVGRIEASHWGLVEGKAAHRTAPYYTGNHRPNAFIVARGPAIAEGERMEGYHIRDVAPTVLTLLGVDPPQHFEGRVMPELTGLAASAMSTRVGA